MEFLERVKGLLTEPSKTFDASKGDTLGDAIKYYVVIVAVYSLLSAILFAAAFSTFSSMMGLGQLGMLAGMGAGAAGAAVIFVILLVIGIIGVFISGAILHIGVYIVGGKKGITQTLKAIIYGSTPGLLLGWIPVVGFLASIWSLILEILGIRQLHELTTGRAIVAVIIPLIIIAVLVVILAAVIAAFIFSMGPVRGY